MGGRSTGVRSSPDSEEDNYFIPISDLLVGFLFIFLILLMAYAIRYQAATETEEGLPADPDPSDMKPAIFCGPKTPPALCEPVTLPAPPLPARRGEGWCSRFTALELVNTIQQIGQGGVHVPRAEYPGVGVALPPEFQACLLSRLPAIIEAYKQQDPSDMKPAIFCGPKTPPALCEPVTLPAPPLPAPIKPPKEAPGGEGWCSRFTTLELVDTIRQAGRGGIHVPRTESPGIGVALPPEFQACLLSRLPDIIESYKRQLIEALLRKIQKESDSRGLKVEIFPESGVLRLPEEILFASGRAEISDEGKSNVESLAKALRQSIPCFTPNRKNLGKCDIDTAAVLETVLVEGHTDNDPYENDPEGNWKLSTNRALNTFRELVVTWPELESLKGVTGFPMLGLSGYAEKRPIAPNLTPEGKRKNRRIDLRFIVTADHLLNEATVQEIFREGT